MRMAELHDQQWRADTAASLATASEQARALFFLALPVDPGTWSLVDADAAGVQEQYWQSVRTVGIARDDVEPLAERLLQWRRPWTVIESLTVHCQGNDDRPKPSPDLIERALRAALEPDLAETSVPGALDYALRILLDRLATVGTNPDVMFELEWAYLPLLEYTRKPHAIYDRLAQDPDLFVDIVCPAFRAKGDTETTAGGRHSGGARPAMLVRPRRLAAAAGRPRGRVRRRCHPQLLGAAGTCPTARAGSSRYRRRVCGSVALRESGGRRWRLALRGGALGRGGDEEQAS